MGILSCCFSGHGEVPEGTVSQEPSVVKPHDGAANVFLEPESKCTEGPREKTSQLPSVAPSPNDAFDASHLQELQAALSAIEGVGFEARCPQLVSCIQDHLDPSAAIRLFGLTAHGSDAHTQHLVQLVSSTGPSKLARPTFSDDGLPGRSFSLALPVSSGSTLAQSDSFCRPLGAAGSSGLQACDRALAGLLMERALFNKAPAVYHLVRETGRGAHLHNGPAAPAPRPDANRSLNPPQPLAQPQHQLQQPELPEPSQSSFQRHAPVPRDCLAEVTTMPGSTPAVFAALPLNCGRRPVGVLWIAVREPEQRYDRTSYTPSRDDSAAAAMTGVVSAAAGSVDAAGAAAADRTRRCLALLYNPLALSQLALFVSMAVAAAVPDPDYLSWLSGTVRRMASCGNLHTLVAGACTAVARHVRWRFHADVAVQSALVPEPDAQVAFMLYPETKQPGAVPGVGLVATASSTAAAAGAGGGVVGGGKEEGTGGGHTGCSEAEEQPRARSGVVGPRMRKPLRRTASQAAIKPKADLLATAPDGSLGAPPSLAPGGAADGRLNTSYRDAGSHRHQRMAVYDPSGHAPAAGAGASAAGPLVQSLSAATLLQGLARDREADTGPMDSLRGKSSAMVSAPAMLFSLSAKAFQMSHTLLYRLVSNWARAQARSRGPGGGSTARRVPAEPGASDAGESPYGVRVPQGFIVTDTARHVADVRQPSRDVCMLLGSKGAQPTAAAAAALWHSFGGNNSGTGSATGFGGGGGSAYGMSGVGGGVGNGGGAVHSSCSFVDPLGNSGRSGAASLVLMAIEVAEGGCMMGLYISFPTLMPQPLLAAVRDSCSHFVSQMLADVMWHKLQRPELVSDFETLRAGVPGSYMSVGRLRDVVDKLQIPMTPQAAAANNNNTHGHHSQHPVLSLAPGVGGPGEEPAGAGAAESRGGRLLMDSFTTGMDHHGALRGPAAAAVAAGGAGGGGGGMTFEFAGLGSSGGPRDVEPIGADSRRKGGPASPFPSSIARRLFGPAAVAMGGGAGGIASRTGGPAATGADGWSGGGGGSGGGSCAPAPTFTFTSCQLMSAAGLPSGGGGGAGAQGPASGVASTVMLDSGMDPGCGDPRVGPTHAMMTVHDLDDAWGMRGIMGALVESIMTTLRASASELAETLNGMDLSARATEGLEDLQLIEILGHGASGVVLRGLLGTVPVAVKLMEMPDADQDHISTEISCLAINGVNNGANGIINGSRSPGGIETTSHQEPPLPPDPSAVVKSLASMVGAPTRTTTTAAAAAPVAPAAPAAGGGDGGQASLGCGDSGSGSGGGAGVGSLHMPCSESEQVRARRTMMRNATELAVMRSVSHVCIVQAFAVYDNVIMERTSDVLEGFTLRRLDAKNPETGGSPICTAIVQELCDRGSLADVLENRSFPVLLPPASASVAAVAMAALAPNHQGGHHPHSFSHSQARVGPALSRGSVRSAGSGSRFDIDMRGVYLTLLEIALALRHLHARRLVHRDLKPANILLKSSTSDPRGWTCKLADFGFALVLDQQDALPDPKDTADAPGTLLGVGTPGPSPKLPGSGSTGGAGRGWCTIQAQACGTVTHMAPEAMLKNSRIDASVDVFSFGIICWELVCGRGHRPHPHLQPDAIPSAVRAGLRPTFTADVPAAYRKLAAACWAQEPHRRPRAADIVSYIKFQLAQLNDPR